MNTRMNFIYLMPFLLFAVVGGSGIYNQQEKFRNCRSFLDGYATTDCQRAQNIHFCTELFKGQIKSRGNKELNRLNCKEEVKDCKTSNIENCRQTRPDSCGDLERMKNCLYQRDCTKHYELLDKYYTDVCLKIECNSTDVSQCDGTPGDNTQKTVCRTLDREYGCVKGRRRYTDNICKMPAEWQKAYKDNTCERPCFNIQEPSLTGKNDEEKCDLLNTYKVSLETYNCKMEADMENTYKSSKCDTRCNKRLKCSGGVSQSAKRNENCKRLSLTIKCNEKANCPTTQDIHDAYAFYGCSDSCNGFALYECSIALKETLNSSWPEQCSYYKEHGGCYKKFNCDVDKTFKELLECNGAASWNTMFSIIISVLLTVQMLERYISLS